MYKISKAQYDEFCEVDDEMYTNCLSLFHDEDTYYVGIVLDRLLFDLKKYVSAKRVLNRLGIDTKELDPYEYNKELDPYGYKYNKDK